jgi:flagellar protein FlgJ
VSISNKAEFFLDFQQFGDLKLQARNQSAEAAQTVAQQFEGLLVQQMLSAMRAAATIDDSQHSSYLDFYQDTYDKQLAQTIAAQDRLGIAKMIMQQMPVQQSSVSDDNETTDSTSLAVKPLPPQVAGGIVDSVKAVNVVKVVETVETSKPIVDSALHSPSASGVIVNRISDNDFAEIAEIERINSRWHKAEQFVADVLPQAQSAAASLGVSAELLLAQAALETGWGKHTMKFDDGRNSFNLFGIKANDGWQGNVLLRDSLEFQDGVMVNQVSKFRAYQSAEHSLADYAEFIQSSPRYAAALNSTGDDHAYIREIHRAGYATDPDYADKIINILDGGHLQQIIARFDSGGIEHV